MNQDNEFDRLAREKLEGLDVPFDEAHWQSMQQVLAEHKGRGRRGAIWITAAALLMISGGVWWFMKEAPLNEVAQTTVQKSDGATIANELERTDGTFDRSGAGTVEERSGIILDQEVVRDSDTPSSSVRTITKESTIEREYTTTPGNTGTAKELNSDPSITASAKQAYSSVPPSDQEGLLTAARQANTEESTKESALPASPEGNNSVETVPGSTPQLIVTEGGSPTPGYEQVAEPAQPILLTPHESETPGSDVQDSAPAPPVFMEVPTERPTENVAVRSDPSQTDSTTTAMTLPQDSAALEPAAPIAPLIPARAPWELSILGGVMSTNTRYTGSNSADWNSGMQSEWSYNAGAEWMHMGRNFGLGLGVHYGTYIERLQIDAVERTTYEVRNFWFLNPVDTAILFITDTTVIGGSNFFTGNTLDTTILVLARGSDSTGTTSQVLAEQRRVNKVSYLEVPLLLDGHLVQGRWSFGLRGGPTLGILTGRKGAIPNSTGDGLIGLNDQPYRKLVLGWTARAYVRYRFNAAWSVGLEPMIRGQFNALEGSDLKRRSTAWGGQISLSYRFR